MQNTKPRSVPRLTANAQNTVEAALDCIHPTHWKDFPPSPLSVADKAYACDLISHTEYDMITKGNPMRPYMRCIKAA